MKFLQLSAAAATIAFIPTLVEAQPEPLREFRGTWFTTVLGLDWPSGSNAADQKRDLIEQFDELEQLNVNGVIFQVRSECDAMYDSPFEPWSRELTGTQGVEPYPYWDPLQFSIDEAHRRGMELHAWLNPYRAGVNINRTFSSDHVSRNGSDFVVITGTNYWLDPGHPETIPYFTKILTDIITRYDVDGIHIDDYFYPYSTPDFPDEFSFATNNPENLSIGDWRRKNTRDLIESMYNTIHRTPGKNHVEFGISPFGIYRPGIPSGIQGLDSFNSIYIDSREWLQSGILDYFTPQIYWGRSADGYSSLQDYDALLEFWTDPEQNVFDRHIIPGLPTYKVANGELTNPQHVVNQVTESLNNPNADGVVHFRTANLLSNSVGVGNILDNEIWANANAVVPASTWLDSEPPAPPEVRWSSIGANINLQIFKDDHSDARWIILQTQDNGVWNSEVLPGSTETYQIPSSTGLLAVRTIDRSGILSSVVTINTSSTPSGLENLEDWVLVENFESPGIGTEAFMFQDPDFSGSSRNLVPDTSTTNETNDSVITDQEWYNRLDARVAQPGSKSNRLTFEFDAPGVGLARISTNQGAGNNAKPNPQIDFNKGLTLAVKLPKGSIDFTLVVRETNTSGPIGTNGGTSGSLEMVVPIVRLEGSPNWQRIYYDFDKIGFTSYSGGDGVLDGNFGVLEAILVNAVEGETETEFELYIDDIYQGPQVYPFPIGSSTINPEIEPDEELDVLDTWFIN